MKCKLCNMDGAHKEKNEHGVFFYCEDHIPNKSTKGSKKESLLKELAPLFSVIFGIFLISLMRQIDGADFMLWMMDFMGVFLVTFGLFKLVDLKGFAAGFSSYDPLAQKIKFYAYMFPFIEIGLGILYLMGIMFLWQNVLVLILAVMGCLSSTRVILRKEETACVCLGTMFALPMTWVTFIENFLMGIMVLSMIFI